ncbi:hypothetical protein PV341_33820 [Streptomyces sp. PA03-1a]|nr:hypothetical protein [Streptomyces sp. PA03-1a]
MALQFGEMAGRTQQRMYPCGRLRQGGVEVEVPVGDLFAGVAGQGAHGGASRVGWVGDSGVDAVGDLGDVGVGVVLARPGVGQLWKGTSDGIGC